MSSKAGQTPQVSEAPTHKARLPAADTHQFAGRRAEGTWQALQRSIGNQSVAALLLLGDARERVHPAVNAALGTSGRPLQLSLRREMEAKFREDLSDVRVHADAGAVHAARSVNAKAFTVGNDIVFDQGEFSPTRESGKRLLTHELAHVVQQRRGGPAAAGAPSTEKAAERVARAPALTIPHPGGSRVGIARQEGQEIVAPKMEQIPLPSGGVEMRVDGVTVMTVGAPPEGSGVLRDFLWDSRAPKTVFVGVIHHPGTSVQVNQEGLSTLAARGFSMGLRIDTSDRPLPGERHSLELRSSLEERPSVEELPLRILDVPPLPPPFPQQQKPKSKPTVKPKAAPPTEKEQRRESSPLPLPPKVDVPPLPAPIEERKPPTPPSLPQTSQQNQPQATSTEDKPSLQSLPPPSPDVGGFPSPERLAPPEDPQVKLNHERILGELADTESIVAQLQDDITNNPMDVALNVVRGTAVRLHKDQQFVEQFEKTYGPPPQDMQAAVERIKELRKIMDENVLRAEKWHTDNPAGESLGMTNERWGTALAGYYDKEWDKGGIHYVSGGAAITGAFLVAFADAAEKTFSFGFHDVATAVAEAYARGDISWNEGEMILNKAAGRAILIAAVTRGVGAATSRLGTAAAEGVGLVPTTLPYGLVSGGVEGGLSAAGGLLTQAVITKAMEDSFNSPASKAIWAQGLPHGKDWAIAIPLGIFLGALGGGRQVQISNEKLVGSVLNTSEGQLIVKEVTKDGRVIVRPVGASGEVPIAPESDITLTYDPASKTWQAPKPPQSIAPEQGASKEFSGTSGESASSSKAPPDVEVGRPPADADVKAPAEPTANPVPQPITVPAAKPKIEETQIKPGVVRRRVTGGQPIKPATAKPSSGVPAQPLSSAERKAQFGAEAAEEMEGYGQYEFEHAAETDLPETVEEGRELPSDKSLLDPLRTEEPPSAPPTGFPPRSAALTRRVRASAQAFVARRFPRARLSRVIKTPSEGAAPAAEYARLGKIDPEFAGRGYQLEIEWNGEKFQPDAIQEDSQGFRLYDNKEVLVAPEESAYSDPAVQRELRSRMEKYASIARSAEPDGCRGWSFTTNSRFLANVMRSFIEDIRRSPEGPDLARFLTVEGPGGQ